MRTNPEAVRLVAARAFGVQGTNTVFHRRFVATFGCTQDNVAELWNDIDQHIAQLRSYIGNDYIETVRARGYRFINPESKA